MKLVRPTPCSFDPVTSGHTGLLAALLMDSYRPLFEQHRGWEDLPQSFRQFDAEVFQNLETLGRCVFLTCLDGQFAGFGSFDPRQTPCTAVIGHNCILPRFQNRGLGKAQVLEILNRLKERSIQKATVTTSEHPFFLPARRMYLSCGFTKVRRFTAGADKRYGLISLEREIERGCVGKANRRAPADRNVAEHSLESGSQRVAAAAPIRSGTAAVRNLGGER
jgi:GNAT superfamily N-acetyltransferase